MITPGEAGIRAAWADAQHSLAEREHAERAQRLRDAFPGHAGAENLAEFLHQNYRAAAKSISVIQQQHWGPIGPLTHDHGWGECHGKSKQYFLRRAQWLMTDYPATNGRLNSR